MKLRPFTISWTRPSGWIVLVWLLLASALQADEHWLRSPEGVIATVQPLATRAGQLAYRAGGNAVDAAIAAALTLGVVDSHNSGLGGGCFILIRDPHGQLLAIDGRETAPAAATRDMYLRDGKAQAELSQNGPLAVAVPGALAAYASALQQVGRLSLAEILNPAADIAAAGHPIDQVMARNLLENIETIRRFSATSRILLRETAVRTRRERFWSRPIWRRPIGQSPATESAGSTTDRSPRPSNTGWQSTAD